MKPSACPHCKRDFTSFNARRKHLKPGKPPLSSCQQAEVQLAKPGMAESNAPTMTFAHLEPEHYARPTLPPERIPPPELLTDEPRRVRVLEGRPRGSMLRVLSQVLALSHIHEQNARRDREEEHRRLREEMLKQGAEEIAPGVYGVKKKK